MIYLVEDDESIRELVVYTLNSQGLDAQGFERPSLFWKAMEKEQPSLVLLDIMLPEEDGLSILKKIRIRPDVRKLPVIMLTAKGSEFDTVVGLDSGADDYIPKPFYPEELIAKIAERFEQRKINAQYRYNIGKTLFDSNQSMVTFDGITQNLSARQTDILVLLAQSIGQLVPRDEILDTVWGDSSYANSMSLNVQITYLRHILALDTTVKIISIKKKGYILQITS